MSRMSHPCAATVSAGHLWDTLVSHLGGWDTWDTWDSNIFRHWSGGVMVDFWHGVTA
jgi:hypothetical protein